MKCVVIYQRDTYKYSVDIIFCNSYAYSNLLWAKEYIVISGYIYKKKLLYEFEDMKVMVRTFLWIQKQESYDDDFLVELETGKSSMYVCSFVYNCESIKKNIHSYNF